MFAIHSDEATSCSDVWEPKQVDRLIINYFVIQISDVELIIYALGENLIKHGFVWELGRMFRDFSITNGFCLFGESELWIVLHMWIRRVEAF